MELKIEDKAKKIREENIEFSELVFSASLEKEKQEALSEVAGEEKKQLEEELNGKTVMLSLDIQPFLPEKALYTPQRLKDNNGDIRLRNFPDLNMRNIPKGVNHLTLGRRGWIIGQQIYANGLIVIKENLLRVHQNGGEMLYLTNVATALLTLLKYSGAFYAKANYKDQLVGKISINGLQGVHAHPIHDGYVHCRGDHGALLDSYAWDINLKADVLLDEEKMNDYFHEKMTEIYWDFGFDVLDKKFLLEQIKVA